MPLQLLDKSDLDMILAWRNSPQVRQHMFTSHVIGWGEHFNWFRRVSNDETIQCYLHKNSANEPDGVVTYSKIDSESRSAYWGFYLSPQAPPGSGRLLGLDGIDMAFNGLNLSCLHAQVLKTNAKSIRFHEKLGFKRGRFSYAADFAGKDCCDVIHFTFTFEDYAETYNNDTLFSHNKTKNI